MMTKKGAITFLYGAIAVLLLLCLFDMPYGYYTFVRFASAAAFCYLAYITNHIGNKDRMILFVVLAILFQPLFKIPLGRVVWIIVDLVVAGYLLWLLVDSVKRK